MEADPDFRAWKFAIVKGRKQRVWAGGFGRMFKARTDRKQTVAVEVVPVVGAPSQRSLRKAIGLGTAECEILGRIRHPNVIQFLKFECSADGLEFYIFTELISGDSLLELMNEQQKPFEESQVKEFVLQICTALSFLHSSSPAVLHRDINCSNIVLTRLGVIKLIGFGVARAAIEKAQAQQPQEADARAWLFLAPEQFTNEGRPLHTAKTDVWALGCSLFEMLSMRPPNSRVRRELLALRLTAQHMPQLPVGASCSLSNFYRRCVNRQSDKRADITELLGHRFLTDAAVRTDDCNVIDSQFTRWDFLLDYSGFKTVICEGRFSRTHIAFTDRHQTAAVKVIYLPEDEAGSSDCQHAMQTFKSDLKVWKSIRHQSIARFLKFEHTRERVCIFAELIAGHSLHELMQRLRRPFEEPAVKKFSKQICSALDFLHSCEPSLTHNGINCRSIMLTYAGVIKLVGSDIDAPIRTLLSQDETDSTDIYRARYLAPEQIISLSRQVNSPKTDIWGLGCAVFEMLSMQPPNGKVRKELIALKVTGQDMPQLPARVSKPLRNFYSRCVEKEPRRRADTAELLRHRFLKPDAHNATAGALDNEFISWDFFLDRGTAQLIAAGRSSKVYKAFTDSQQTVAVKVIDGKTYRAMESQQKLKEFIENAKLGYSLLSSIRHSNILLFLKLESPSEIELRIFTELVAGQSLWDFMRCQQKPFDEAAVMKFSLQICSAMEYLHCQKPAILHRSIRCSSLLLTHLGDIKLINFSHAVECNELGSAVGPSCGCPHFLAPELLTADDISAEYRPQTDVWAFGCTVFEMLSLKPPNFELSTRELAEQIRDRGMPRLPTDFSDSLSDFYSRCVATETKKRADARQLLRHRFLRK